MMPTAITHGRTQETEKGLTCHDGFTVVKKVSFQVVIQMDSHVNQDESLKNPLEVILAFHSSPGLGSTGHSGMQLPHVQPLVPLHESKCPQGGAGRSGSCVV